MTPERAAKMLGDLAPVVELTCRATVNHYGGAWVVYARIDDYERPLTQSASPLNRWIHDWERLMGRMPPLDNR